jgi:ArsR family transcriptional regulator, arsenate/arsenite/antimonite-responsive transcriptional repressor
MQPKQIAKVAKALSDETRLKIFQQIASQDELNCGDICETQVVGHATVSHHLRVLTEANLIEARRQGQFIYYKVMPETLDEFAKSVARMPLNKPKAALL